MTNTKSYLRINIILAALLVSTIISGCVHTRGESAGLETRGADSSTLDRDMSLPTARYYDFDDILVPVEFTVDRGKSFIHNSHGVTAGVLAITGSRIDIDSLISFFKNNMAKDNWQLASSVQSPRTLLFFNKPNRTCVIDISEKQFRSEVEIWVAPANSARMSVDPN